jgi:hypothetical protein
MNVRRLTSSGIRQFERFLSRRRNGHREAVPTDLLEAEGYSETIDREVEVDQIEFDSRLEMAKYLSKLFSGAGPELDVDQGLWSWLALYYFDQLCPSGKKPGEAYRYVLRGDINYRHYYRNLINGPFRLYQMHGETARTMLAGPVDKHPDIAEQIASRPHIVTNCELIEVVDRLYWDPERGKHKAGVVNGPDEKGTVHRMVRVHDQLELTYDIKAMGADQIDDLLPDEFDVWRD